MFSSKRDLLSQYQWENFLKESEWWLDRDIHLSKKYMFLGSEGYVGDTESGTDFLMARKAIKNLEVLDSYNPEVPITIIMNNPGGNYYDGMAIFDAIKGCESEVHVKVYGQCFSMASIIMQAATHRMMSRHSKMMLHDGANGVAGTPKTTEAWSRESERIRHDVYALFLEKVGVLQKSKSLPSEVKKILLHHQRPLSGNFALYEIEELFHDDLILSAQEAKKMNLVDEVF